MSSHLRGMQNRRRVDRDRAAFLVARHFGEIVRRDRKIHTAFLMVHSDRLDIHLNMAEGRTGDLRPSPQQPYYIASVGKLFTSVLIAILSEQGLLTYEHPIADYLDEDMMKGLHVYKGKDYSHEIRIRHLLNHTSGLHDFFGDKPRRSKRMLDLLLDEPSRFWTPREAVQWSKQNLKSHFPPGRGFHYSDTGYHLLGLVIEKITSRPFHEALRVNIFHPVGMRHSCLWQHSQPDEKGAHPVAGVFVDDKNIVDYVSLSIDYAGGGIVSTSDDLLLFMRALVGHELIREDTFGKMRDWARFFPGIDYGYGLMNVHTVPVFMPGKYNCWGNAGSVGSFMFYNPRLDLHVIGTLNRFRYHRNGLKLVFKCIDFVSNCECATAAQLVRS